MLPTFEHALRARQRRAILGAASFSVVIAGWVFLFACQITDDVVDPLPAPALLIIGVITLLLAVALISLSAVVSRSGKVLELHRVAAAIASRHLPADIADVGLWERTLRPRSDQGRRTRIFLLIPLLEAFALVQLNHTSNNIYGTLLWAMYLVVMLVVGVAYLTTFTRTRSAAQQLLTQLSKRIRSVETG